MNIVKKVYQAALSSRVRERIHLTLGRCRRLHWKLAGFLSMSLRKEIELGLQMKLHADSVLCELIYFGSFEKDTRELLRGTLKLGDTFLDVGANVGLFTLIAAHQVGTLGKVHAFEPMPITHKRLRANVKLNNLGNVTCHCTALSDGIGESTMTISKDGYDAWNSLGKPYMGGKLSTIRVQTTTLDEFVCQHNLTDKITAMKIDVEGWETYVIAGAKQVLSSAKAPLLVIEFTEEAAAQAGSSCLSLYQELQGFGYQMFAFDPQNEHLCPLVKQERFRNMNVVATKRPSEIANFLMPQEDPAMPVILDRSALSDMW